MNPIKRRTDESKLNQTDGNRSFQSKILPNTTSRFLFVDVKENQNTVGLYSKQQEGVADAEPKVMEPYVPIPYRVPRKVELDRKKKEYKSFNLTELLETEVIAFL